MQFVHSVDDNQNIVLKIWIELIKFHKLAFSSLKVSSIMYITLLKQTLLLIMLVSVAPFQRDN